jgi:hypothetical protein
MKGGMMELAKLKLKSVNLDDPNKRLYVCGEYKIAQDLDGKGWKVFDGDKYVNDFGRPYCFKAAKNFLKDYVDQKMEGK